MTSVISSITQSGLSNKHYLETNLIPLQIYYARKDKYIQSLGKKDQCALNNLFRDYETILGFKKFVNVKVAADKYKTFEYKEGRQNRIKVLENKSYSYYDTSDLSKRRSISVPRSEVYFGIYKPLSNTLCKTLKVYQDLDSFQPNIDQVQQIYKVWAKVETLRLSIEAMLRSIPSLKF